MGLSETALEFKRYKVAVLMPTYNNELTVGKVISDVLRFTEDVIIVNDGSTDSTAQILQNFPQADVIGYPVNKGKGYALRTGFRHALGRGFDYVITIDSDGQHFAEDLPRFLDKLTANPSAIIMGVRNMAQAGIPGKSSFGHKFSNFWFWVETGITMNDTQSGYRLYPIRQISGIRFITRKFEFEIEVMVRAVWSGIRMEEVPVKIFYARREERISHFRPFKDFTRISILNTVLVTIALLYIKPRDFLFGKKKSGFWQDLRIKLFNPDETNRTKAVSVGFGIFMGIIPLWGFQMIIAVAVALRLRLNATLVLIASNISIPPLLPFILFLSHLTGAIWMGDHAHFINFRNDNTIKLVSENLLQYILGAVTLACLAGVLTGLATWLILLLLRKEKS